MINPSDIDNLDTEEGREMLDPEFISEMTNGKGEDN